MAPPDRRDVPTNSGSSDQGQTNETSHIFQAQVNQERTKATPDLQKEIFRANDQVQSSVQADQTIVYPNKLISEAQSAGKEIASYLQGGRSLTDIIQYRDAQGQIREMTVGDRIDSLKTLINQDCQNAITAANELVKQKPNLEKDLGNVTAQLQTAAQSMGLDYNSPNFRDQALNNPQLADLAKQQALLQSERMAPGAAMLTYAMLKAGGLTENPAASMESFRTTGMPKPSQQELNDAFLLVSQAGRTNQEIFNSPLYANVNTAVKADYAQTQQEKGNQIVTMLKQADQMSQSGDATKAEEMYKNAWKLGEGIDQKFLAAQLQLKDNQNNPQVSQALVGILSDVKEARMHYANFLVKQGKYGDALPIALSVGADTPEFAQQDPTYNKLVSDATFGKSLPQGELQAEQAKFAQLMQDKKYDEATTVLDKLTKNFQDTKATLDSGSTTLAATKKDLDTKLQDLEKKKDTTDKKEYDIEKARLENEKKVIDQNEKMNADFLKQGSYLKYLQGVLAYSKDDKDTAHALFEEVKKTDPELAGKKELQIDQLLDATKHQNWFQRNWHAIATIGAVVAGVAVGIGVGLLTGPGGIAAGIGTTAAIMGAVGGGAVAGGLVYSGVKGAAVGFDKVGFSDFKDGAFIGGSSALMVSGGPLLGGARAAAAGTEIAGGTAATAIEGGTWVARGASALNLTGRTVAIGTGFAAAKEGYAVAFDGKSWGDAAKSFAWEAPAYSVGAGMLGVTGKTLAVGSGIAAAKEGLDVVVDGKSLKDAGTGFFNGAPIYASSLGIISKVGGAVAPSLTSEAGYAAYRSAIPRAAMWTGVSQAGGGGVELGMNTYAQWKEHKLDPNNPTENSQIWERYNQLNPNLYRPADTMPVPTQQNGDQGAQPQPQPRDQPAPQQRKPLTQAEIDHMSGQDIVDEPVKR